MMNMFLRKLKRDLCIVVAINALDVGGAEKHLLRVLPSLKKRGYNIILYLTNHRGVMFDEMLAAGIPIITPPLCEFLNKLGPLGKPFIYSLSIIRLSFLILKRNPSILHFFLPGTYVLGGISGLLARARCMVMSRRVTNEYQKTHPIVAKIEPLLHKYMKVVLATSLRVGTELLEEGVPPNKLGLIYNGVEVEKYNIHYNKPAIKRSFCLGDDTFIIVILANLYKRKGHKDLFYALSSIKEKISKNWKLLCIGRDGGEKNALESLRDNLGLREYVTFLGQQHDIPQLLSIADMGVLSSHEEGFSNALLECMAAGLPMVVTDVGGNAEAIVDKQCGFVVPPKQPQQLAEALLMLALDKETRDKYGNAAKERVKKYFSLEACVLRYDQFYEAMLASEWERAISVVKPPSWQDDDNKNTAEGKAFSNFPLSGNN
ncbi:glycosyltransferase family 4 protein [Coxiella burnetii]|uniref:glycosyltransferase family 4 protein n=1 Tax=Coxiella burnetii TaxID=777 RepID=UPI000422056E|nr:glycosyltransferase [Coxiella burnetii]ATN82094.1 glycosyl transferase [Coxiella burnetii]ATN83995.1 glycosyl transferase [Coxiella burnetii]MDE3399846.1 glycosyltransferase [Coxiella burnetii]POZ79139.1 glycosyl transferase [Coxiella burnetii]